MEEEKVCEEKENAKELPELGNELRSRELREQNFALSQWKPSQNFSEMDVESRLRAYMTYLQLLIDLSKNGVECHREINNVNSKISEELAK